MTFGNVMHTTIKEFVSELRKRRKISFEEVTAIYDREWSSAGFSDDYHEDGIPQGRAREQLEQFLRELRRGAAGRACTRRKTFELHFEHDVIVKGRIDQVNRIGAER